MKLLQGVEMGNKWVLTQDEWKQEIKQRSVMIAGWLAEQMGFVVALP